MANQSWFLHFFQCSKHLSWNKGFKEKMPRKLYVYVCTRYMVPHVFSRREDLSGSNRTLQWNSKHFVATKMRRRYKNWPPAFSNMQWPPPHPLYASAWFGQHATFTKEFQGNFLPRFKKGQLKISSSREMDVFIISCCFILSISCCHSVPTSLLKKGPCI